MAAVMEAFKRLDEKFAGNNTLIGRITGIDREKVPKWRDGTAPELKYVEQFAKCLAEADLELVPFRSAEAEVMKTFLPILTQMQRDIDELKSQGFRLVPVATEEVPIKSQRGVRVTADDLGDLAKSGIDEQGESPVRRQARGTGRKTGSG